MRAIAVPALLILALATVGCATRQTTIRSSTVEYLYSAGEVAQPARTIQLQIPARVGVAFVPGGAGNALPEGKKQQLLRQVADAFRGRSRIAAIEVIPSTYLGSGGGFAELDRLRAAFHISEIVLISYDGVQFSDTGAMGVSYWVTYGLGTYFIKGEKNETRTFLDAVVYDIPSRAMLFHASGQSSVKGRSSITDIDKALRERMTEGFDLAVKDLIPNLDRNLQAFAATIHNDTVTVEATPAIPPWTPKAPVDPAPTVPVK